MTGAPIGWGRTVLLAALAGSLASAGAWAAPRPAKHAAAAPAKHAPAAPAKPATKLTALYADPRQPDLTGVWLVTGYFTFAPDRSLPAFKAPYDALYAKRMKAFNAGKPIDDVTADCLPPGMPHIQVVPYPFEIIQTPGRLTLIYEYAGQVRRFYLDGAQPKDPDPTYYGTSVGHWEGDTLVVTTSNIRGDTQVDFSGVPHSEALTITERFRRVDHDTLQDQITLDDPKAYAQPFTTTRIYKLHPDWSIGEYVCEENNRNKIEGNGVTGFGVPAPERPVGVLGDRQ
jgi:hypothetical protein